MRSFHWAKIWIEVLDDAKMGVLSDRLWRRTIELILIAKELDEDGFLPPLNDIAWRLRIGSEQLETDLVELARIGIAEQRNGRWFVTNFEKRQGRMTAAERKAKQREREKRLAEESHDTVTSLSHDSHDIVTSCDEEDALPLESHDTVTYRDDKIREDIRQDKIREDPLSQYVTFSKNGDKDPFAGGGVREIVDWWMALAGIGKPADPHESNEKLYGPAEAILKRLNYDAIQAKELIESKRQWMISNKEWTPKWLSGVVPSVLADLDRTRHHGEEELLVWNPEWDEHDQEVE